LDRPTIRQPISPVISEVTAPTCNHITKPQSTKPTTTTSQPGVTPIFIQVRAGIALKTILLERQTTEAVKQSTQAQEAGNTTTTATVKKPMFPKGKQT